KNRLSLLPPAALMNTIPREIFKGAEVSSQNWKPGTHPGFQPPKHAEPLVSAPSIRKIRRARKTPTPPPTRSVLIPCRETAHERSPHIAEEKLSSSNTWPFWHRKIFFSDKKGYLKLTHK